MIQSFFYLNANNLKPISAHIYLDLAAHKVNPMDRRKRVRTYSQRSTFLEKQEYSCDVLTGKQCSFYLDYLWRMLRNASLGL